MLLIFDSNYISWTCAFALSRGMTYSGNRTEIIFGFMKQIIALTENFEATQIVFCWDSRESKRREVYPEYKGNRRKELTEEEKESLSLVYKQFDEIRLTVLPELGFWNIFTLSGYESDDLIANIVLDPKNNHDQIVVISSDSDLYQLLNWCSVYSITKAQTMDKEIFTRHYGISPEEWIHVKAIAGCNTDNVKGVGGIGEKKAISYLKGNLNHGKMYFKIINSQDVIDRNLALVTLPYAGCPSPKIRKNNLTIDKYKMICETYGMESLLEKKNLARWTRIIERID